MPCCPHPSAKQRKLVHVNTGTRMLEQGGWNSSSMLGACVWFISSHSHAIPLSTPISTPHGMRVMHALGFSDQYPSEGLGRSHTRWSKMATYQKSFPPCS
ncbi:hypothetical protein GN956_G8038 [Arapaima gigas]